MFTGDPRVEFVIIRMGFVPYSTLSSSVLEFCCSILKVPLGTFMSSNKNSIASLVLSLENISEESSSSENVTFRKDTLVN